MPTRIPASDRFVIYLDDSKTPKWRWRLIINKSNIIATSHQGHEDIEDCEDEICIVKDSKDIPVYEKLNNSYERRDDP